MAGVRLVDVLDREQGLLEGRGAVGDLAVGQDLARLDGVAVPDLPRRDAHLVGEKVDEALERELALAHAEAAERAGGRVVGVPAKAANVRVLVAVRAHGVRAGALEDRAAQRRVGSGVEVDLAVQAHEGAVLVAAEGEGALHVVALGVEVDGLLAREAHLDGAVHRERGERGQVLHGDVLLAAKAAAHEHGLHDHLLGRGVPAEHVGDLLAGVVGALVGRAHLDAALVREGDGALGLEERVLGERRLEGARHLVRGARERRGRVAADHVALLADVVLGRDPVAEGEIGLVEDGRTLGAGLLYGADGLEDLVLHLDGLLCLLERGRVLGHHERDGVAHAVGDVALGGHDVPVVEQVSDRVHGHVGGREHGQDARHGAGLLGVDLDHAGARVLGADGAGVGEVGEVALVDVVGVLAVPEDLAAHVNAEGALAHAVVVAALEPGVDALLAPQDGRGQQDALDDLLVAGAAADVAADGHLDLVLGWVGHLVDEGRARHDHAGDAESALDGAHGAEGVDEGLLLLVGQALHGHDVAPVGQARGEDARLGGAVVHEHGAGAARALGAAVLDGGELEVIAQVAQKRLVAGDDLLLAVDGEAVLGGCLDGGSSSHGLLPYWAGA